MKRSAKRVQTPTVLQLEAVECGAASLAMILGFYGRVVPLEELRVDCGVSRDGSKANNILRAARRHGLVAKGFKREPAELRQMQPPMIIHWNFNHFVVLDGFSRRGAHINDPGAGPNVVPHEELDQSFTGVALSFTPSETFSKGGERPPLVGAIAQRLTGAGAAVVFVIVAGLALVVPGLVAAAFSKIFIDEIVIRGITEWTKPLMITMGATSVAIFTLTILQQRYLLRLESRLSLQGSARFFWHVLRLPIRFFTQRYAGDIAGRVSINDKVARLLSGDLASTAVSLLLVVIYGGLLFHYDVVLSIVAVLTASLNFGALRFASCQRTQLSQRLARDRGKMVGTAMGALQTIDTVKATGSEPDFFARWSGQQAKVVATQQQLAVTTLLLSALPPLLMTFNTALIFGIGGARIIDGQLTAGMLVGFQALLTAFLAPVNRMVDLGGIVQEVKGEMLRLDDVLRAAPQKVSELGTSAPPRAIPVKLSGHIELREVTFGYSPLDPPLIDHFSLSVAPGSRVALVGGSGSGKSTIARILAGLEEPWSGEVLFDGHPRQALPRETLMQSLAMVDQEVCLFEDTMRANLTLWDGTLSDDDVKAAARDACLHDEIVSRPSAYASAVEEGGRNFSGGQRQRMELARALAGRPSILILDEATSALDPITEKIVDDNLRRRGCTCVIVAHRLSTIRDCDEILVLERGKIVQRGTHDELAAMEGLYRALIAAEAS